MRTRVFLFLLVCAMALPVVDVSPLAEAGEREKIRFASVYVSLDAYRVAPGGSFLITAEVETTPENAPVTCTPYVFLPARMVKLQPKAARGFPNPTWRFTVPVGTRTTFVESQYVFVSCRGKNIGGHGYAWIFVEDDAGVSTFDPAIPKILWPSNDELIPGKPLQFSAAITRREPGPNTGIRCSAYLFWSGGVEVYATRDVGGGKVTWRERVPAGAKAQTDVTDYTALVVHCFRGKEGGASVYGLLTLQRCRDADRICTDGHRPRGFAGKAVSLRP